MPLKSIFIFVVLFVLAISVQSFAAFGVNCQAWAGNPGEQILVNLQVVTYLSPSNEEVHKVYMTANGRTEESRVNLMVNHDHSGYSFFVRRFDAIPANTLFAANEFYVYTNGQQSTLSQEWKYIGTGACTPGYRLIPTLCESIYEPDGGFKTASMECQITN